jgi:hypothetical protein
MTALALSRLSPWRTLDRATIARGIGFGTLWGVTVAGALLGLSFYQCGSICLGQIVETTTLAIGAGVIAIGPLAARRGGKSAAAR